MNATSPKHDLTSPRPWFGLFFDSKGWIALIAAFVLFALTIVSVFYHQLGADFKTNGVEITAQIAERWIETDDDSDSYHLTFVYTPKSRTYRANKTVSRTYYRSHETATEAQIWYLPSRPGKIAYFPGEYEALGKKFQIGGLVAGLVGCGFLWFSGMSATRAVKARRHGARITAKVQWIVERKSSGKPTGYGYMVWLTGDGQRGESLEHPMGKLNAIGLGASINVFRRGQDTWWEGDVGPRETVPRQMPIVRERPVE